MENKSEDFIIEAPKTFESNENIYVFNVKQADGTPIYLESQYLYDVESKEEEQQLTIPSKDDLRCMSNIFNKLKSSFLNKHEEWFEQKFTSSVLDDLFKNFLQPNVLENCIDLTTSLEESVLNKMNTMKTLDGRHKVIPKFCFKTIILNTESNKMTCKVVLDDFTLPENDKSKSNESEEQEQHESVAEQLDTIEPIDVVQESDEVKTDELEEYHFNSADLDESEIKINVEDYLIIYKYILGQIKENKIKEIEKICHEKNVEIEIADYEEIFDDSDDEYLRSDDSEMSDDDTFI